MPVRQFFGDGWKPSAPLMQQPSEVASMDRLVLRPVAEFQLDEAAIERFRTGYRAAFGAMASRDALYDPFHGLHGHGHWLPLFHEELALLTDYCPGWQLVLDHEADAAVSARDTQITDFYGARRNRAMIREWPVVRCRRTVCPQRRNETRCSGPLCG